jgi:Protein of unknown function (DUF2726)
MQQALPWITALGVLVVIAAGLAFWATRPRQSASLPLPNEWSVAPRAIFSVDERRAYRHLRDAFPEHVILAKLPLIRLCQPVDPREIRYWFELLGSIHVTFAVCTTQGRVLAAIDLDGERPASRRTQQIKQGVLSTCRIRHLRCTLDHLPSAAELQRLLPGTADTFMRGDSGSQEGSSLRRDSVPQRPAAQAPLPAMPTALTRDDLDLRPSDAARAAYPAQPAAAGDPKVGAALDTTHDTARLPDALRPDQSEPAAPWPAQRPAAPAGKVANAQARKERKPLWQDSGLFQDSFFGIDNLRDAGPPSNFGSLLAETVRGRSTTEGPQISADPAKGMLESERAKLKPPGKR